METWLVTDKEEQPPENEGYWNRPRIWLITEKQRSAESSRRKLEEERKTCTTSKDY